MTKRSLLHWLVLVLLYDFQDDHSSMLPLHLQGIVFIKGQVQVSYHFRLLSAVKIVVTSIKKNTNPMLNRVDSNTSHQFQEMPPNNLAIKKMNVKILFSPSLCLSLPLLQSIFIVPLICEFLNDKILLMQVL